MESDIKKCLDDLMCWWKEHQNYTEIYSGSLEELEGIMKRLCLKYLGREKV